MPEPTPMLIALPCGLSAGGVTTWALRLCGELTRRGHACALVLHRLRAGDSPINATIPAGVRVVDLTALPAMDAVAGDVSTFVPHYARAVESLRVSGPVVISPNLMGDCYAIAAALTQTIPDAVRTIGWCHLDSDYDRRVLAHYEPILHAWVGVSDWIVDSLRRSLPARAADAHNIPYGVVVPEACPVRPPLGGRPLRLVYPGRVDENVKRISALVHMVDALTAAGVKHELTIIGDGPASAAIDAAARTRPSMRRLPPVTPDAIVHTLDTHDLFVLPSRVEGLSVAMLEAMAHACVPVVTMVRSGAAQAIENQRTGLLIDAGDDPTDDATPQQIGQAMAAAIGAIKPDHLSAMARAAWATARERYSMQAHADRVCNVLERIARTPPRAWPTTQACSFTSTTSGGSGTVPRDAASRLARLFGSLTGRRVLLHGTGRHTIELGEVIAAHADRIAGFADDDPSRAGATMWGWPIVSPDKAASLGATDVIISSWLHQEAIWARRAVYERQGLRVHRVYPGGADASTAPHKSGVSSAQANSPSARAASAAVRA
ncbi:MAG: glycosyltransferase family 4 protein [Phycisphaerales bacterium]|nr:glycosyltransferase family 4 protein [Phycisphaerales bacterium]